MLKKFFSLLSLKNNKGSTKHRGIDTAGIVENIRKREERDVPQGKQIFSLEMDQFVLRLDREFTGHYRISTFIGNHKIFGFTITEEEITDEQFALVWKDIITFLRKDPSPTKMPETKLLKSHFFGKP